MYHLANCYSVGGLESSTVRGWRFVLTRVSEYWKSCLAEATIKLEDVSQKFFPLIRPGTHRASKIDLSYD